MYNFHFLFYLPHQSFPFNANTIIRYFVTIITSRKSGSVII